MAPATHVGLREAAERLGVHYMTIYRYVRTGRLRAQRDGATWAVAVADLEKLRGLDATPPRTRSSRPGRPQRLLDRLTVGDERGAWSIVEEALTSGNTAPEVYTDLLVPTMRAVGDQWEQGRLSIAAEHRASAVATRIVGRLGPMFARRGLSRGTVVLGAPEGDLHALPSAIVADLLRGRGFDVLDMGAHTPAGSFVESARAANRLVAVLIGVSSTDALAAVADAVAALRSEGITAPVFLGGGAIPDELAARGLGADGWSGADAGGAIAAVEGLAPAARRDGAQPATKG